MTGERLTRLGFRPVGTWKRSSASARHSSPIDFELIDLAAERVIYAFVERRTRYIGICDGPIQTLEGRMRSYRMRAGEIGIDGLNSILTDPYSIWSLRGSTARTAARIMIKTIVDGRTVEIWALHPRRRRRTRFKRLDLDLVRGLEYPIIRTIQPDWSGQESLATGRDQAAHVVDTDWRPPILRGAPADYLMGHPKFVTAGGVLRRPKRSRTHSERGRKDAGSENDCR